MVRYFAALLLFCPALAAASCGTHRIQYYDLLMRESRYPEALHLVLADLQATHAEEHAFKIASVADDETDPLTISPATLQAGKSAACQQAASVLSRVRDHRKDRERLQAYHQDWIASRTGWAGCNTDGKKLDQPDVAAKTAQQCLEDPSLEAHQAAIEIRALMAKASAAEVRRLNDEDAAVLQERLDLFHDGWSVFEDKSTNSYYLPSIKQADQQSFCRAVAYARQTLHLKDDQTASWQASCKTLVQSPKPQVQGHLTNP